MTVAFEYYQKSHIMIVEYINTTQTLLLCKFDSLDINILYLLLV